MKLFLPSLFLLAHGAVIPFAAAAETEPSTPTAVTVKTTRDTLSEWVKTQQLISKEKKEWREGKEMLQARIELMQTEIATLDEKIKQAEGNAGEAEKKKVELLAQSDTLKAATTSLGQSVAELETKLRRLFQVVPEPIQVKLNPLYQRMPTDPNNTKVTLPERYQSILGILNEINKLNGEITLATEIRPLADAKPAEVKTLYVGLGQAYFLSPKGEAGVGRPSDAGWKWESANRSASDIAEAISVLQGKGTPKFISLPVHIQ